MDVMSLEIELSTEEPQQQPSLGKVVAVAVTAVTVVSLLGVCAWAALRKKK